MIKVCVVYNLESFRMGECNGKKLVGVYKAPTGLIYYRNQLLLLYIPQLWQQLAGSMLVKQTVIWLKHMDLGNTWSLHDVAMKQLRSEDPIFMQIVCNSLM